MSELETVLAKAQKPFVTQVVLYRPAGEPDSWAQTDLYRKASSLPGVRVLIDPEGTIARRFGAETSGHTVVFNSNGELVFSGGITASRGHAGENAGTEGVLAAIDGRHVSRSHTYVFGCQLANH